MKEERKRKEGRRRKVRGKEGGKKGRRRKKGEKERGKKKEWKQKEGARATMAGQV